MSTQKEPPLTQEGKNELVEMVTESWKAYEYYIANKPYFYISNIYYMFGLGIFIYFFVRIWVMTLKRYIQKKCVKALIGQLPKYHIFFWCAGIMTLVAIGIFIYRLLLVNDLEKKDRNLFTDAAERGGDLDEEAIEDHRTGIDENKVGERILASVIIVIAIFCQMFVIYYADCVPISKDLHDMDIRSYFLYDPFVNVCTYLFYMVSILCIFFSS